MSTKRKGFSVADPRDTWHFVFNESQVDAIMETLTHVINELMAGGAERFARTFAANRLTEIRNQMRATTGRDWL